MEKKEDNYSRQTGYDMRNEMSYQTGQQGFTVGSQPGAQFGNNMDYKLGTHMGQMGQPSGTQTGQHMGAQAGQQFGNQSGQQFGQQFGQQMGPKTGMQTGQQFGQQMGQNAGMQIGQQFSQQMGQKTGMQTGMQTGQQTGQWSTPKFGAHEIMMVNEVLIHTIDSINQFELYRPYVKDQQLNQILDNQINHMYNGYQNTVNYLHNQGVGSSMPYRAPKGGNIKYGLRQPSPMEPNTNAVGMDDRDVASGMLGCAKAGAMLCTTAALECADSNLRSMISDCAVSKINQAYELFHYMNQKGMYQVPTLMEQTTQTMMNTYQVGSRPMFQ